MEATFRIGAHPGFVPDRCTISSVIRKWDEDTLFALNALRKSFSHANTSHQKIIVPKRGVEPLHPQGYWTLNPARLPIPPLRQLTNYIKNMSEVKEKPTTEARRWRDIQESSATEGHRKHRNLFIPQGICNRGEHRGKPVWHILSGIFSALFSCFAVTKKWGWNSSWSLPIAICHPP
jgi:hypothetical protein